MKLTIDELIEEMKEEYTEFLKGTGLDNQQRMEEERNNPDCNRVCTANEMMLDILRKYQQIEQIMKETHEGCITKYQKIEEVIKDENDATNTESN